jgi:heme-degrading monooxygenase HmoA
MGCISFPLVAVLRRVVCPLQVINLLSVCSETERTSTMHTIKEITPFEIPAGKDEAFLKGWNEIAGQIRQVPGVLSIQLHESLDPETKFRFVAVTEWESSLRYAAARFLMNKLFEELRRQMPFAAYPASYRLVVSATTAPQPYQMFSP